MRRLGILALTIVLLIGGAVAWWKINYPTYTYRYRMTVEVSVDGKVHSGSSVIEVTVNKQPQIGSAPPQVSRVRGEAVFVDLGAGRNLIALLAAGPEAENVDYPYQVALAAFGLTGDDRGLAKIENLHGSRKLPPRLWPTFISFSNLDDPLSARVVPPDELPQILGGSVGAPTVRIQMTSDPVTEEIAKKFPWWNGPFPWLKPMGGGVYVNRPTSDFAWHKGMFKRNY